MSALSLSSAISFLADKLNHIKASNNQEPVLQLSVEIMPLPLIAWLSAQPVFPRIYWQGRDKTEEVAAIGSCKDFSFTQSISDDELAKIYHAQCGLSNNQQLRYYGGVAFDRTVPCWPEFGRARFVLPRIELRRSGKQYKLFVNLNTQTDSLEQECLNAQTSLANMAPPRPLPPPQKLTPLGRSDKPEFGRWKELVEQVTNKKFNKETPKVVLSRLTQLEVNDDIDPWMVLACWQGRNPNSFQFGFQFSPERTFISCSPERLFRRKQQELFTEALAGTTTRGFNQEEDEQLAQQLMDDTKNSHENQLVRQHIVSQLTPLSNYVGAEERPSVFKLNHIQHLHRSIRAELKPSVDDFQLLQALHPTPAVGGLPRDAAMSFIRQREGYMRGWYAGACGYLNKFDSEFSVAIRSALLEPGRINLFAGAGIVSGSDPETEWQELENKLATIMSILVEL